MITEDLDWRDRAACVDADPELFFPIGTAGPALEQIEQAKRVCLRCPARPRCLAWALEHDFVSGIWGATTEAERRLIRDAAIRPRSG